MDLPDRLHIIHQPQRLRIMALLWRQRDVSYTATRDALDLTDGNLATHTNRLAAEGLLESRRVLAGDRFEVRFRITRAGHEAFQEYIHAMQSFLDDSLGT